MSPPATSRCDTRPMSTVAVDRASSALGRVSLCEAHAPEAHAPEAPSEGDDTVCFVCKRGDDEASLLLCDGAGPCPRAAHTHCLGMESVPEGDWFCDRCKATGGAALSEALRGASENADASLVARLLARGADMCACSSDGRCALAVCVDAARCGTQSGGYIEEDSGHFEVLRTLLGGGAAVTPALLARAEQRGQRRMAAVMRATQARRARAEASKVVSEASGGDSAGDLHAAEAAAAKAEAELMAMLGDDEGGGISGTVRKGSNAGNKKSKASKKKKGKKKK